MTKAELITQRVEALRHWLRERNLTAYIFPSTDPHMGEYVPDHWKGREWISGFNGSAGTAVVTLTRAALWTDSRYWLAAEEQLAGTPFEVIRCGRNVATPEELVAWIALDKNEAYGIAYDPWVNTVRFAHDLRWADLAGGVDTWNRDDACGDLWTDRPPLPLAPIEIQPLEFAGQSAAEKLAIIREEVRRNHANAILITQLDEIAWALNLRGSDVHCTPIFVAYLLVLPDKAVLYTNPAKITPEVAAYLSQLHVETRNYEDVRSYYSDYLFDTDLRVQVDPDVLCEALYLDNSQEHVDAPSPIPLLRAVKNEAEIAGFRSAMLKDGVAMVKFLKTLSPLPRKGESLAPLDITEMGVDKLLTALRAEQPGFRGLSFDTIAGYGAHAAIVHYEATPETDIPLEPHGLLLLDSGGQYQEGTTDITRTIPLGPLTDQEHLDYTLVLKGHIRLATAVFPEGTTGTQLDVLARYAMWQHHKNYGHGTGHGVGSFLAVHEGPHQFRMNYVPATLRAGMTVTIEPGIYIAGSHGVRIENTMLIQRHAPSHNEGEPSGWLCLEPLTLCPIDTTPILWDLMQPDEIAYLNHYHARVREALLPLLDDEADRAWLIAHTEAR